MRRSLHLTMRRVPGGLFSALLLPALLALGLLAPAGPAGAQGPPELTLEGRLTVLYGDPPPGSLNMPVTLYMLRDGQGARYALSLAPGVDVVAVGRLNGRRVRVVATRSAADPTLLSVRSLADAPRPGDPADRWANPALAPGAVAAPQARSGSFPYAVLMCKFADKPALEPRDKAFFQGQFSTTYPGFGHYIRELSYGQLDLAGTTVHGWYTLPRTEADYTMMSVVPMLNAIAEDCTAAADAEVNFAQYFGIVFMLNGKLKNAAWSGNFTLTRDGLSNHSWHMAWLPYSVDSRFGWLEHGVVAHELAHTLDAPHSGSSTGYPYGSSWDVVSNPQAHCNEIAGAIDPTYGCVGQHVAAYNKQAMNIVPPGRVFTYTQAGQQGLILERLAKPAGADGTYLLASVPILDMPERFYVVEARWRAGYDRKLPADGVLIHEVDLTRHDAGLYSTYAWLVAPPDASPDAERCSGTCGVGAANAVWPAGSTFSSAADNLWIRVDAFSAVDGTARVTIGRPAIVQDKLVRLPLVEG